MPKSRTPNIVLIGGAKLTTGVEQTLRNIKAKLRREWTIQKGLKKVDRDTAALVLAYPVNQTDMEDACRLLDSSKKTSSKPRIVVMPDGVAGRQVRKLYENGATLVAEWPRERRALPQYVLSQVHVDVRRSRKSSDVSLSMAISTRLKANGTDFGNRLKFVVIEGVAYVTGEIDALWKQDVARSVIASTPGVKGVFIRKLLVGGKRHPDRKIANAVRLLIKNTSGLDESTIAASVERGRVKLAGTTRDRREMDRLLGLIRNVRGVRGIDNYTTIAPRRKIRDQALAGQLRNVIRAHDPASKVDATVFGGTAVLSGWTDSAERKREIETLVSWNPSVDRVVNKILVS